MNFNLLASENLNQLQHLELSENPLEKFEALDQCPNHPLTIHMQTLKNFALLEELEKSPCFGENNHLRIDMTGSESEESFECDHWCKFSEILRKKIMFDTPCNCTEAIETENENGTAAPSSGTTSNGLKKVFFVILFLIFLLVIRYHWKTIRSFWYELRNKNHSDHGKNFER